MTEWLKVRDNCLIISIHLQPGASRDEIKGIKQNSLAIKLCAPAIEGRANEALVRFIAGKLKAPPSSIKIIQGLKSKKKVLAVPDISVEYALRALSSLP